MINNFKLQITHNMGQTLSEPVTTKESTSGGSSQLYYAASSMQGWRISILANYHCIILKYN